jgi:hypothetical protein
MTFVTHSMLKRFWERTRERPTLLLLKGIRTITANALIFPEAVTSNHRPLYEKNTILSDKATVHQKPRFPK